MSPSTSTEWQYTTKPIPYELSQEIAIKFEEGLLEQAITSLKELMYSDMARPGPVFAPRPQLLSVMCTLAVHPHFTNRARDANLKDVSIAALEYLNALYKATGPVGSGLTEALTWPKNFLASRRGLGRARDDGAKQDASAFASGSKDLRTEYGNEKSVFNNSSDFWHVAGWAFRCSRKHPRRWRQAWLPWMEFVVGTLETDWRIRCDTTEAQQESLMAKYFVNAEQITAILRAIFADESDRSATQFKEIWRNETKPPPKIKKEEHEKKQKLDLDEGTYGDYLDPSSQEEDESGDADDEANLGDSSDDFGKTSAAHEALAVWGGYDAGKLRIRLLSLVLQLAYNRPDKYGDFPRVVLKACDYLRPLPLEAFLGAFSPQITNCYPRPILLQLLKCIMHSTIQVGVEPHTDDELGQKDLITHYLPYAANTSLIVDNARLSICIESLMGAVRDLKWTEELEEALIKGIAAREAKATRVKGTKGEASGAGDELADTLALLRSAERLKLELAMIKL